MDKKTTEEALQKTGKGLKGVVGEFKEFISKGNVLDMAVGLIVGSAFTAIVNSLVDDILMPVIGTVLVGINFSSLGITIPWGNHPFIAIGSFLNTIITFLLTALCVFLIVKTMNMFRRKQEEKPAPPKPSKEEQLLTEIRDLLAAQQIDLVIKLEDWKKENEYDRLGLEDEYAEFLGNKVACHSLPIRPGRNLAVICETAAVNHRQKKMGYNAAQELYRRVQENITKGHDDDD